MDNKEESKSVPIAEAYLEHGLARSQWRYVFSGLAMQGILAGCDPRFPAAGSERERLNNVYAEAAVGRADALLKALDNTD